MISPSAFFCCEKTLELTKCNICGIILYMNKYKKELLHLWGKVGLIVNLSQMIEYTLANVLAFDEILREFEDRDSMYVYEYNEFAKRAGK